MSSKSNPELENFELEINAFLSYLKHPSISDPSINTADLARSYFRYKNKGTDVLPAVVRAISSDYTKFMIERPPQEVKLNYTTNIQYDKEKRSKEQYTIPLPWMVYILDFESRAYTSLNNLYLYARPSPVMTEDEILYSFPLPNIYLDGEVCLEKVVHKSLSKLEKPTMQAAINCVLSAFWDSSFNCDADATEFAKLPQEFKDNIDKDDYHDENEDGRYQYFFNEMSKRSIEQALDLSYACSNVPHFMVESYLELEQPAPPVLTVGEWIRSFESECKISFSHMPNPLLAFIKNLM